MEYDFRKRDVIRASYLRLQVVRLLGRYCLLTKDWFEWQALHTGRSVRYPHEVRRRAMFDYDDSWYYEDDNSFNGEYAPVWNDFMDEICD